MCSTSPTEFDALIVYFPKWTAWFILGIIKKHSNLMDWSWTTTVFLGTLINLGAPLY